jgi:hypothetical protein
MVQINFADKQVNAKIVYYGPGMSGKTTNLEVIHQRAPEANRGDLTSISTDGDRTLFFDFMPLDLGMVAGMRTCFQVYTVPGQVYYSSTRKLVLQGVDGVIFIADSSPNMMEENLESMRDLEANLAEYGRAAGELPMVIQYNKRDVPGALSIAELEEQLNTRGVPAFEAIANTGQGVFPTLKAVAAAVLDSLHHQSGSSQEQPAAAAVAQSDPVAKPEPVATCEPAPAPKPTLELTSQPTAVAPPARAPEPEPSVSALPEPEPVAPAPEAALGLQLIQDTPAPPPAAAPAPALALQQPSAPKPAPQVAPAAMSLPTPVEACLSVAAKPQVRAPKRVSSPMAVQPGEALAAAPRPASSHKSFPTRSQPAQPTPKRRNNKKGVFMTIVIVAASVGFGAALGSIVLWLF